MVDLKHDVGRGRIQAVGLPGEGLIGADLGIAGQVVDVCVDEAVRGVVGREGDCEQPSFSVRAYSGGNIEHWRGLHGSGGGVHYKDSP